MKVNSDLTRQFDFFCKSKPDDSIKTFFYYWLGSTWNKGPGGVPGKCRIIYASRTHSQLAQVIGEFQRSPYQNVASVILASREQVHHVLNFNKLKTKFLYD